MLLLYPEPLRASNPAGLNKKTAPKGGLFWRPHLGLFAFAHPKGLSRQSLDIGYAPNPSRASNPAGLNKKTTLKGGLFWRPHGDSNPGYRRERAMS